MVTPITLPIISCHPNGYINSDFFHSTSEGERRWVEVLLSAFSHFCVDCWDNKSGISNVCDTIPWIQRNIFIQLTKTQISKQWISFSLHFFSPDIARIGNDTFNTLIKIRNKNMFQLDRKCKIFAQQKWEMKTFSVIWQEIRPGNYSLHLLLSIEKKIAV